MIVHRPGYPLEILAISLRGGRIQAERTLISGTLEVGIHSAIWQGHDDRDQRVPSGVYFYRLQTGRDVLTRRMTMIQHAVRAGAHARPRAPARGLVL